MPENLLKQQERVAFALRALYRKYGYLPYKMSKFESYDLYASNKDFLVGDGVITFNDTDGKLLALKPDVTLSIIKNCGDDATEKRKVYYHENVYRISGETKQFKEIMQAGVECIGDIDTYDVYETVCLAAESLRQISASYVLDISHLGLLSAVFAELNIQGETAKTATRLLADKNVHELNALLLGKGVCEKGVLALAELCRFYGSITDALALCKPLCSSVQAKAAYDELERLQALLAQTPYAANVRFDFSVVGDMKYYNGIVMKGFVDGVCEGVLSGGRYDTLMARMGKNSGAIGFAVYLDLLEGLEKKQTSFDIDVLVLYDEQTDLSALAKFVRQKTAEDMRVSVQKQQGKLRYRQLVDMRGANHS